MPLIVPAASDPPSPTSDDDEEEDDELTLPNGGPEDSPPSNRHLCSAARAASHSAVNFCAIQLEIADGAPDVDVYFNRGKSLEDVFQSLRLDLPSWADSQKVMSARKKARGRREMGDVTVQTFTKESESPAKCLPRSGGGEQSKSASASKESTPASSASNESSGHVNYVSGNPFVEVTKGVLHLYKENQTTSLEEGIIRSQMLCMLGVPAKIKTPDLLQFTAPCQSELDMMRIITDGASPNQFMVLLRFRCQEAADEFYKAFNGQRFNSLESDVCSLVYVSKVETCKESEYYPMASHTELPLCSICLERMDESVSTVLTILCNHTFHGSCLAQWEDSTCPVCRYVQTPEVVAEQLCSDCGSSEDLWICLVCGYVGCGRYVGGHSHAHFTETNHCYTMELGQNRVWDYVGDNFVHRLMQTDSADGKLVEAEGNGLMLGGEDDSSAKCVEGVTVNSDEKLESIQLEYTYLLTSQLEAQRRYYEEKISRLEEVTHREIEEMASRTRSTVEESKEKESKLAAAVKEKSKADQKIAQLSAKMAKLTTELTEERQMNESLRRNQSDYQARLSEMVSKSENLLAEKEKELADTKDQLRDVMFFLEAQQKIAESPLKEELEGGDVAVGEAAAGAESGAVRKKKKKPGKR